LRAAARAARRTQAVFLSASFAYAVDVVKQGNALSVAQAPMGAFQSTTGTVGIYDQTPLLLHVIPSGSSSAALCDTSRAVSWTDYWKPMSLAHVLPQAASCRRRAASRTSRTRGIGRGGVLCVGRHRGASSATIRSIPIMLGAFGVFNLSRHFTNPLGVDVATNVGVNEQTERMFVSRRRANSSPDEAADVVVLQLDASCGLIADNRVFVQPQPVSISVLEAHEQRRRLPLLAHEPRPVVSGPGGRLYRWDLAGSGVANVSLDHRRGRRCNCAGRLCRDAGADGVLRRGRVADAGRQRRRGHADRRGRSVSRQRVQCRVQVATRNGLADGVRARGQQHGDLCQ
jgi:hypothetical protein